VLQVIFCVLRSFLAVVQRHACRVYLPHLKFL
jgi:hypothetical protein